MTAGIDSEQERSAITMAEQNPTILIRPSRGWVALNLPDLWMYRELLAFGRFCVAQRRKDNGTPDRKLQIKDIE